MGLFSRIKTPFNESSEEHAAAPGWPVHSVGRMLRERREELGLDLETASTALRIKPIYLAALEQDRAQDLPGPTYAVGFIRAYAHYLGFDGPRVLERYKAESAADVQLRPDLSFPVPLGERSIPGGPILLVAAIVALCGYGTWYYLATGARTRPERIAAVPAALEHPPMRRLKPPPAVTPRAVGVAGATPPAGGKIAAKEPGPANPGGVVPPAPGAGGAEANTDAAADRRDDSPRPATPAAPVSPPALAPPAASAAPPPAPAPDIVPASAAVPAAAAGDSPAKPAGRIDIRAIADCWIEVRDANRAILFSRVLKAGETYHVPGPGLVMRVGSAGALAIDVDGKAAPPLGPLGALRRDVVLDPTALLAGTAVRG